MNPITQNTVVMIPTYNEAENIADLIREILALPGGDRITVLVADDNSPDGTGAIVEDMGHGDARIRLLNRTKRRGRGTGGIDGFKAAVALRPDVVVEMDGDFSHQPKYIPALVGALDGNDVVLGSRFIKGGKDADRGIHRRVITFFVRRFLRKKFGFAVKDVSSGFRAFRLEVLERIDLDDMISIGPSVVLEVLHKAALLGFRIGEVPIVFVDRTRGKTKLNFLTLLETLIMAYKIERQYKHVPKTG
jgi:dolichol-phosphate mannosyltransferase